MRRLHFCLRVCLFVIALHAATAKDLRIGVFSLFHPAELVLRPAPGAALRVEMAGSSWIIESPRFVRLRVTRGGVLCAFSERTVSSSLVRAAALRGRAALTLAVPGKIERRFLGTLEVQARGGELIPIVITDIETAVTAAVAAESSAGTPPEALRAQAIATRSFYLASPKRHRDFDFCDTTHCQFLREPPQQTSAADRAAAETKGLVLLHAGAVLAAMFTASCGGRTRTLAEAGLADEGYPYYPVDCGPCRTGAKDWECTLPAKYATLLEDRSEAHRIELGRTLGWDAIPGYQYELRREGDRIVVHGRGEGHGIGLCQRGAAAMARAGATHSAILNYYYPNTVVGFRE